MAALFSVIPPLGLGRRPKPAFSRRSNEVQGKDMPLPAVLQAVSKDTGCSAVC